MNDKFWAPPGGFHQNDLGDFATYLDRWNVTPEALVGEVNRLHLTILSFHFDRVVQKLERRIDALSSQLAERDRPVRATRRTKREIELAREIDATVAQALLRSGESEDEAV